MIFKLHCCIFLVAICSIAVLSKDVPRLMTRLDEVDELLETFADAESDVAPGEATNDEEEKDVDSITKEDDEYQQPLETRAASELPTLVRMCGSEVCDPARYSALTEALCGYNIITGDPYSSIAGEGIDPGIKNRIFNPTKSVHGQMILSGVTARNMMQCDGGVFSEVVTSVRDFQRSIDRTSSRGSGFGFSISADVEVEPKKGVKVTTEVEATAEAAFTNSKEMGRVEEFFESGEGMMVIVQAQCVTNAISLEMFQLPPFDEAFRAALIKLSKTSKESEAKKKREFKRFIVQYGTHFIQSATMGAKMMETTFVKNSTKSDFTSDMLKTCAGRSFNLKFLGFNANHNSKECSDEQTQELEKGSSKVIDKVMVTRGSKPKGDVKSWAEQKFVPAVLKMELKPIVNLLSDDILYEQQGLKKKVKASALRDWFVPMYDEVCSINGWDCTIPKGCGFSDNCKYNENCVNIDKKEGTFKCEALDLCRKSNGGCDHKCAMDGNSVKCTCNVGYTLKIDKKSCEGAFPEKFKSLNGKCSNTYDSGHMKFQFCFNDKVTGVFGGYTYTLGIAKNQKWSVTNGLDTATYSDGTDCYDLTHMYGKKRQTKITIKCGAAFKLVTGGQTGVGCDTKYYVEIETKEACTDGIGELVLDARNNRMSIDHGFATNSATMSESKGTLDTVE